MASSVQVGSVLATPTLIDPTLVALGRRANIFQPDWLELTDTQKTMLYVFAAFTACSSCKSLWLLYSLSFPFRMMATTLHEFFHAFAAVLTCSEVHYIIINPDSSGLTVTSHHENTFCALLICSSGYVGSALIGAAFVFAAFDVVAAKGATMGLGVVFLVTLFWARKDWLTWVTCLVTAGIVAGCWFIDHARPLRYLVLLLGVMSSGWSLKDTYDIFHGKVAETNDYNLAAVAGGSPKCWALVWSLISMAGFAAAIILGLLTFKRSDEDMFRDSQAFLPR